jgi:hypothetical protein
VEQEAFLRIDTGKAGLNLLEAAEHLVERVVLELEEDDRLHGIVASPLWVPSSFKGLQLVARHTDLH